MYDQYTYVRIMQNPNYGSILELFNVFLSSQNKGTVIHVCCWSTKNDISFLCHVVAARWQGLQPALQSHLSAWT